MGCTNTISLQIGKIAETTEFVHPTRFAGRVLRHRESLSIFAFIVPRDLELTASEPGFLPHRLTVNW